MATIAYQKGLNYTLCYDAWLHWFWVIKGFKTVSIILHGKPSGMFGKYLFYIYIYNTEANEQVVEGSGRGTLQRSSSVYSSKWRKIENWGGVQKRRLIFHSENTDWVFIRSEYLAHWCFFLCRARGNYRWCQSINGPQNINVLNSLPYSWTWHTMSKRKVYIS